MNEIKSNNLPICDKLVETLLKIKNLSEIINVYLFCDMDDDKIIPYKFLPDQIKYIKKKLNISEINQVNQKEIYHKDSVKVEINTSNQINYFKKSTIGNILIGQSFSKDCPRTIDNILIESIKIEQISVDSFPVLSKYDYVSVKKIEIHEMHSINILFINNNDNKYFNLCLEIKIFDKKILMDELTLIYDLLDDFFEKYK